MDQHQMHCVIKQGYAAQSQCRTHESREPAVERPEQKHRRSECHQEEEERWRIFDCVQKRQSWVESGFLSCPSSRIAVDIGCTQNDKSGCQADAEAQQKCLTALGGPGKN